MSGEDPITEELRLRQLASERAERQEVSHAETEAEADTHQRRADKASYLRHKLEEQQQADREADHEPEGS
jgi:hypothetical protein